ncbi:MAG: hypothetical protein Q6353_008820 [Candidatus Sigynarchaeum springense]
MLEQSSKFWLIWICPMVDHDTAAPRQYRHAITGTLAAGALIDRPKGENPGVHSRHASYHLMILNHQVSSQVLASPQQKTRQEKPAIDEILVVTRRNT